MKKNISGVYFIIILAVFGIVMFFLANADILYRTNTKKYFANIGSKVENTLYQLLDQQDKTNKLINDAIKSDQYDILNPYVLIDPYHVNPLSAVIVFETKEKESVDLYINDLLMTTFEESTEHVIPVYGLYSNTNNFVMLKLSKGVSNTIKITTEEYDSDKGELDLKGILGDKKNFFMLGAFNSDKTSLRAFDYNGNLVYYMNLDYLSSYKFENGKILLAYNQKNSYKNLEKDLLLEMDFLGHITNVKENKNKLTYKHNRILNGKEYLTIDQDLYQSDTPNYSVIPRIIELENTTISSVETRSLEAYLDNAKLYKRAKDIRINGNIIETGLNSSGAKDISILLVSKNTSDTYIHYLRYNGGKFKNSFSFSNIGEYALYLKEGNEYYNLNTAIVIK